MADKRVFIPPPLCGCEVAIMADWVKPPDGSSGRIVSYQHPKPTSIQSVELVAACATHDHFLTDPFITDETYGGEIAGYLRRPVATPDENLYVALTRYTANRWRPDTCDCRIHSCIDRTAQEQTVYKQHPKHSAKCRFHLADDDAHTAARTENILKNEVVRELLKESVLADDILDRENNPTGAREFKPSAAPIIAFDEDRNLRVRMRGAGIAVKDSIAATIADTLKTNRVIFE